LRTLESHLGNLVKRSCWEAFALRSLALPPHLARRAHADERQVLEHWARAAVKLRNDFECFRIYCAGSIARTKSMDATLLYSQIDSIKEFSNR